MTSLVELSDALQQLVSRASPAVVGVEQGRGAGTGVVVASDGYLLTNDHVAGRGNGLRVRLPGGETTKGELVGSDPATDLAVVKVTDVPLIQLPLADPASIAVGQLVVAIGNPFRFERSVSLGIVSALDRSLPGPNGALFEGLLQTDAAINPGNSGGPLVDMAGQVIGINTAILTGGRGYEGVGFAMPSNTAISVYDQIVKSGRVTRGSIGVSFQEELGTNQITLKSLGAPYGVVIEAVEPGSPAEKAGLKGGDVITAVNGAAVKNGNDLVNPIASAPIGSRVKITYYRDKQEKEATATVEDRTHVFPNTAGRVSNTPDEGAPAEFGLHVESLTPEKAQHVGVEGQKGVLVSEVEPASFADDIQFASGDVISEVNGQPVASVDDYRKAVSKLKAGENVVFKVLRHSPTDRVMTVFLAGVVPAEGK